MKSLIFLEEALLENSQDKIAGYFSEIDRQTSNEMMRNAGEQFKFKTCEVNGMVIAKMEAAAYILGYSTPWGLSKLLASYQIMTPEIGWFLPEVVTKIRKVFDLSVKDSKATFITWDGFLVAGMHGQNAEAKKVKLYLLKMETVGRVAIATDPKFEYLAKNHELKRLEMSLKYICRIEGMKDSHYKDAAIDDYERLTGRKLEKSTQQHLFKEKES